MSQETGYRSSSKGVNDIVSTALSTNQEIGFSTNSVPTSSTPASESYAAAMKSWPCLRRRSTLCCSWFAIAAV